MIYFLLYAFVMIGVCWLAADIDRHERSGDSESYDDDYLDWLEYQRDRDRRNRMVGEYDPYYNYGCDTFIDGTAPREYFDAARRRFEEQEEK